MTTPDQREYGNGSELRLFPGLIQLGEAIASPSLYDEQVLRQKYLESESYRYFTRKHTHSPFDKMVKEMSELHVSHVMEHSGIFDLDRQTFESRLANRYIPDFNQDTYGAYIYRRQMGRRSQNPIAEIDELALLKNGNNPVAIEVEIGKSKKNARTRINNAISTNRLALLSDMFSKSLSFGYLVVVDPSKMNFEESPEKTRFVNQGGIITAFPVAREGFMKFVADFRKKIFR